MNNTLNYKQKFEWFWSSIDAGDAARPGDCWRFFGKKLERPGDMAQRLLRADASYLVQGIDLSLFSIPAHLAASVVDGCFRLQINGEEVINAPAADLVAAQDSERIAPHPPIESRSPGLVLDGGSELLLLPDMSFEASLCYASSGRPSLPAGSRLVCVLACVAYSPVSGDC